MPCNVDADTTLISGNFQLVFINNDNYLNETPEKIYNVVFRILVRHLIPVSYTHLDVYKRQTLTS